MLTLRPHHLLCTEFFEGKGYSEKFTGNMYKIILELEKNPEIFLAVKSDVICSECPRNCISGKAFSYDRKILEYCNLNENTVYRYSDLKQKVKSEILEKNFLENICGDCQWYSICSKSEKGGI